MAKKAGIYPYLLTGDEKHLNIRVFTKAMKLKAFEIQNGACKICGKTYVLENMEADHVTPWAEGGKTDAGSCQMLCKQCNCEKGTK